MQMFGWNNEQHYRTFIQNNIGSKIYNITNMIKFMYTRNC